MDLRSITPPARPDSAASEAPTELQCSARSSDAVTTAPPCTLPRLEGLLASVVSNDGPGSRQVLHAPMLRQCTDFSCSTDIQAQRPRAEQQSQDSEGADQRSYPSKDMGGATGKYFTDRC